MKEQAAKGPRRAVKGTIGGAILVRVPEEMHSKVMKAAKRAGVSASEWVREAIALRLSK